MSDTDQPIYQCNNCEYKSSVKSNLTRHKKSQHGEDREVKKLSREKILALAEDLETRKSKEEADDQIDLDDYINDRVNQILKQNNMPPVKVPRDLMKTLFSGTVPTFLAGSIMGWILSQILPPFFFSIRNHQALQKKLNIALPPQMPTQSSDSSTTPKDMPIELLA